MHDRAEARRMHENAAHTQEQAAPVLDEHELRFIQLMCERKARLQKELPVLMNLTKKQVARVQQKVYAKLGISSHHELLFKAWDFGWAPCPCAQRAQTNDATMKAV